MPPRAPLPTSWLKVLRRIERDLPCEAVLHLGHGAIADPDVLTRQARHLAPWPGGLGGVGGRRPSGRQPGDDRLRAEASAQVVSAFANRSLTDRRSKSPGLGKPRILRGVREVLGWR